MDEFSYLSVLVSVILGLAVTQVLKGFRAILLSRVRIRMYWPVPTWAGLLLLLCTQHWWAMFGMRHRQDWTFEQFGIVLLNVIFIYMVAGLVFPDFYGDEVVDLKQNFYAHRGWFFAMAFAIIAVSVIKSLVLDHRLMPTTDLIFHAVFGVTLLLGAFTRSELYHKTLPLFCSGLFIFYILMLYTRMQQ